MSAGDSQVSICNLALTALGEDPITSLNDRYKGAILAKLHYDPVRRETLRGNGAWNFAKQQAQLAASSTKPLFTYDNAFPLPADFIRMWDEPEEDRPDYEIMSGQILSNDGAPLEIVYVWDNEDPTTFDAAFVVAFAIALAAVLAEPLTQSGTKADRLAARAADKIRGARLVNAQEASSKEFEEDVWLRSRF